MLLRVAQDLSELAACAEQTEQENILGASRRPRVARGVALPAPVLLTDTARRLAARTGLRDAALSLYASYPRTVSHDARA